VTSLTLPFFFPFPSDEVHLLIFSLFPAQSAALRYAVHDSLATCAFSGLFLLKIANLFPDEVELPSIVSQVEQLAQLLSEIAAERYALTIRFMLANLRRKLGPEAAVPGPLRDQKGDGSNTIMSTGRDTRGKIGAHAGGDTIMTGEGLEGSGFTWPFNNGALDPNTIPLWLQEAQFTDLGLPIDGSDGIFLNWPDWNAGLG